jgi:predicted double-glycine peptidase
MNAGRLILAGAFAGLALTLCAPLAFGASVDLPTESGGSFSVPVKSMKQYLAEIRFRSTVPQKYDFSCGSAAIATLLTYHYGRRATEQDVIQEMFARGDQPKIQREGFSLLDMKVYLESKGFRADGFEATLEQVVKFGAPGIVLIQDNGYKHFVVLKGVEKDMVLLGDPARGGRIMDRAEFESIWLGRIFFVIHSHRDQSQFNVASQWYIRPTAVLGDAINRDSLIGVTLLRRPASDF